MVKFVDQITITVSGPTMTGKSAIMAIIADALERNNVFIQDDGEFEHPVERAQKILKEQLSVTVKLVETQTAREPVTPE